MTISDFAIRRPVITVVTMLALVVFGLAHGDGLPGNMVLALDLPAQLHAAIDWSDRRRERAARADEQR